MKTKEQRKLEIIQLYNEEKEALDNEYESDKSDLPQMLWKSGTYGPFKQGETIEIDSEIADILLKSGKVEEKKAENGNR